MPMHAHMHTCTHAHALLVMAEYHLYLQHHPAVYMHMYIHIHIHIHIHIYISTCSIIRPCAQSSSRCTGTRSEPRRWIRSPPRRSRPLPPQCWGARSGYQGRLRLRPSTDSRRPLSSPLLARHALKTQACTTARSPRRLCIGKKVSREGRKEGGQEVGQIAK